MTAYSKLRQALPRLLKLDRELEDIKINQGRMLAQLDRQNTEPDLSAHEFKVFSQWGEDGILQYLTRLVPVKNRTFIEFGVEDFFESNCRFLMMKDNWRGFVIDGSPENIERMRASYFYWRYQLRSTCAFITRDNVTALLEDSGFDKEVGILSVDVDGVDWYLLRELEAWRAAIVVVEYNGMFGSRRAVTVPYDAGFYRTRAHASNVYYGASLPAFDDLLKQRGYALVGVNSMGSNAFFVRRDLLPATLPEVSVADCFRPTWFREGRDANGKLLFESPSILARGFPELPLVDTITGAALRLGDVLEAERALS